MSEETLKTYKVHFKRGGNATTKAARFDIKRTSGGGFVEFYMPAGERAAIYAPLQTVAAVIPAKTIGDGQDYYVYLDSDVMLTVRAHAVLDTDAGHLSFKDAENNRIADIYVSRPSVLVVVPSGDPVSRPPSE